MEFRILGPLEVWEGDRALSLGGAKQRAVLAILLIQPNRVVSADRLIELLWGDDPPETANNSLQVYVSHLRKLLEPERSRGAVNEIIVSQPPGYMIRIDAEQIDAARFGRLTEEARQLLASDPSAAADKIQGALKLWRGPAFADLADEPFALAAARRLSEMRLKALEDRIEAELALGRHADLVGALGGLVAEYPRR